MANITFEIDDEVLRQVRIIAAQHDTSIDEIVCEYFNSLSSSGLQQRDGMNGNLQSLFDYSIGRIGRGEARKIIGVTDFDLATMLRESGFPPPRANKEEEEAMLEEIKDIHFAPILT